MTSDLRIQGEVVVNSEKAESAFNRVGDKATQMANEVATSAGKAGQAVDKIGDGAGASAEKFTRAESRISASIKRATNELELLGKTASQRLEFNIADKGLDAAKFEPALKKLRELEAQALQAQRAASGSLDKMGVSAAQTAAALRGVPAQFTDIITSLQGGQAPLTVFLQQGGQLKDMFGGAGNAAKALGGYVAGLINPFTGAAAAGAALAYAYNQGAKEADAYRAALITTGNAAGTTTAQLKAYAQEVSAVVGTQGKAAESLAALASTGKIGAESLKEAAQAAVQYERATGQALDKTADQFASLRNEPLAAVLKLNDGMNFLTDSTYKQIKSLEEQGKTAEAANVAQRAFADTLSGRAGEMERNLGTVERGWLAVKDAAKSAWDAILNVGRASTNVDQLAAVRKQIADREKQLANGGFGENEGGAAFGRPSQAATERLRAELSALQAQAAALEGIANQTRVAAEEERKRGEQVKATAAFDKAGEKFLTDKARMERELAAARVQGAEAGKSQAEIEQRLAQIRESYAKKGGGSSGIAAENKELRDQMRVFADLAGVSSTYYADLANAQKQRAAGVITEQQYVQVVEALIKKQPFAVAIAKEQAEATKAQAKASEEAARAHLKYVESFGKGAAAAQQQADQLRTEEAAAAIAASGYYSLAQAIELVTIARLEEKREGLLGNEEAYLAVQKEIDARKELLTLIGSKEARKAAEESAKDAARDWERAAADINRSLTDALLRGFESGKGFAENFRDTLKNMFNTLVLRPIISAVMQPVSMAVNGAVQGGVGVGGGSNVLGMAGNVASLFGAGGIGGSLMAGAGWLTGATTFGGALGAGASLIGTGTMAGAMSGIGMIAGALGPIALGVAALTSLIGGLDDSGTPHAGAGAVYSGGSVTGGRDVYSYDRFDLADMNTYSDQVQGLVSPVAQSIGAALDAFATAFGQQAGYTVSTAFADDSSKDASWGALRIEDALGQVLVDWNSDRQSKWAPREFADGEEGQKQYLALIAQDTRQVLLDMDLPSWADEILEGIGDAADMDALTAAMTQISKVQTSFEQLGASMQMFAGITDELQSALMGAAGGIDALVNSAGAFYQGFYTEAERMDALRGQLNTALSGLDLTIDPNMGDDAKAQFRQAVEDAMAAGDAELAASLLAISGNFATAADYFEQLSQSAAEAAKKAAEDMIDSTYDLFRRAVDRDRSALQDQAAAISETIGAISSAVDMLKSNARELYGTVDTTQQMLAAQGMVYIEDALAGVRAGASVADYAGLSDAIGAARSGISNGAYTSQFERERDALVLAGQLSEMAEIGDQQLTFEERQLKAINEQLEYLDRLSKLADDAVNGTAALTETVQTYFARLMGLLDPQKGDSESVAKPGGAFAIGGSGPGEGSGGSLFDRASWVKAVVGQQLQFGEQRGEAYDDTRTLQHINAGLYGLGISQSDIANAYGVPLEDIERLFAGAGIPKFDVGTNYIQRTGLAVVHEGEAIVPKAFNPWAGGQGMQGGNERLERLVEALTAQNARLEARLAAIEGHAKKQADQFESYSNGGTYSRQKALT